MKSVVSTIARNEEKYIEEWIDWHLNLGFDEVWVFDNNDADKPLRLRPRPRYSRVKVWSFNKGVQADAHFQSAYIYKSYTEATERGFDWIYICDVDEFIDIQTDINTFIAEHSKNNTIGIHFPVLIYTDNNIIYDKDIVNGRVTSAFTKMWMPSEYMMWMNEGFWCPTAVRYQYQKLQKSITRCGLKNIDWKKPQQHHFMFKNKKRGQNPKVNTFVAPQDGFVRHYFYKNLEYFLTKKAESIDRFVANGMSTPITNMAKKTNYDTFADKVHALAEEFFAINERTSEKEKYIEDFIKAHENIAN